MIRTALSGHVKRFARRLNTDRARNAALSFAAVGVLVGGTFAVMLPAMGGAGARADALVAACDVPASQARDIIGSLSAGYDREYDVVIDGQLVTRRAVAIDWPTEVVIVDARGTVLRTANLEDGVSR